MYQLLIQLELVTRSLQKSTNVRYKENRTLYQPEKLWIKLYFQKKNTRIDNLSIEPILFEWPGILITLLLKKSATSN